MTLAVRGYRLDAHAWREALWLLFVATGVIALLALLGSIAKAQSWGAGGCGRPAPVWSPAPLVPFVPTPAPAAPVVMPAPAPQSKAGPAPVGQPPAPAADWRWADLPGVGWGWVHKSVPDPKSAKAPPCNCPVPKPDCKCGGAKCPCEVTPAPRLAGQIPPGGVDWSKMEPDGEHHYSISGRRVAPRVGLAAVGDGSGVPDDAGLPWVTVVGTDAERAAVLKDMGDAFRQSFRVKAFPPGHRAVADFPPGLVFLQAPNGRLLVTLPRYDGADKMAAAFKAKLDQYDAAKDPGPGKAYPWPPPAPEPAPDPRPVNPDPAPGPQPPKPCNCPDWMKCVAVAVVAAFLWLKRRAS